MVDVSADHLAGGSAGGGYIPQRANNFSLEIAELEGLRLALKAASFPTLRVVKGELAFENEIKYYIQGAEFEPITVSIRDFIDQDIAGKLYDWFKQGYDPETGSIGNASDYKKDAVLILHGPDGSNERKWKWQGVFIEEMNMGEGDMEARGEPVLIELTLSVDKVLRA